MWPFVKKRTIVKEWDDPNPFGYLADLPKYTKPNPGRELAKLRNPNKRAEYKAFHNSMRELQGKPPIQWAD